eukprot:gene12008-biopygen21440
MACGNTPPGSCSSPLPPCSATRSGCAASRLATVCAAMPSPTSTTVTARGAMRRGWQPAARWPLGEQDGGAGVARAIGYNLACVARAWRGHGAGMARAFPVPPAVRGLPQLEFLGCYDGAGCIFSYPP